MPNYEHFKKYDEWSKQKPSSPPPAPKDKPKPGFSRLLKSLRGGGKSS